MNQKGVTIAVVDDEEFYLKLWEMDSSEIRVLTFPSPREFWEHMDAVPEDFESLSYVVTDLYFNDDDPENCGREFAIQISKRSDIPVILNSNLPLASLEHFKMQTEVKTTSWRDIEPHLA